MTVNLKRFRRAFRDMGDRRGIWMRPSSSLQRTYVSVLLSAAVAVVAVAVVAVAAVHVSVRLSDETNGADSDFSNPPPAWPLFLREYEYSNFFQASGVTIFVSETLNFSAAARGTEGFTLLPTTLNIPGVLGTWCSFFSLPL